MPNIFGFAKDMWAALIPMTFAAFGYYFDECERERVTRYRDKSQLFGGTRGPNDPPSWGSRWSWAKYPDYNSGNSNNECN